jgi:hypothetical protein
MTPVGETRYSYLFYASPATHKLARIRRNPAETHRMENTFFDDGDLRLLPEDIKLRLATAAREVDLDHLPGIDKFSRQIDQDRGYEL